MNGDSGVGAIALSVCGGCYGLFLLAFIVSSITSRRTAQQRGRRVELWSDDDARMHALLEAGSSPAVAEQIVQGNKINAIIACRIDTGLGLKEAKELVEHYEDALYRYEPWDSR